MGQYYHPSNLDTKEFILSHDFGELEKNGFVGLKIMEHSYIGNPMMNVVERFLMPGGKWYKNRIVWAGDYADGEAGTITKENPDGHNIYHIFSENDKRKITLEELAENKRDVPEEYKYLVNHSLKQYVDKSKIKDIPGDGWEGWKIHPLSLLVAEGNGRGGGDFHGEDKRIGLWARHIISVEQAIPEGYEELDGQFVEES